MNRSAPYRITDAHSFVIADAATSIEAPYESRKDYKKQLADIRDDLSDLQRVLHASNEWALLLVFQGMDTAGKDSTIRHVLSGVNPAGCQVVSFKRPSEEELDHDYLWRCQRQVPERGRIGVFNRSYYEEVLVVRVHPQILDTQRIPSSLLCKQRIWEDRYDDIVQFERYLSRNGTRVVKFFLHLSKEEQKRRLLARIDDPDKNWKFETGDLRERGFWDAYQEAYEAAIDATATEVAPWYVIPADDKPTMRLLVAEAVRHELRQLDLAYPRPPADHARALADARSALLAE